MKIYTRQGDDGLCDAIGKKVKKYHPAIKANGEIDGLQAQICFCLEDLLGYPEIHSFLRECAIKTGLAMSDVCDGGRRTSRDFTLEIENKIDGLHDGNICEFSLFEGRISSRINIARCTARRAERAFWEFADMEDRWDINPEIGPFLNRLSDYLFAAAYYIQTKENSEKL